MSQNLDGFAAFDGPPANAVDDHVVSQDHSSAIGSDQHRVDKFGRAMDLQGSPGSASLPNPRPMQASDSVWFAEAARRRNAARRGCDPLPLPVVAIDQDRLSVVMVAVDLVAWTGVTPAQGELDKAEPKTLRYRLLHVAARLPRTTPARPACPTHLTPGPWKTASPKRTTALTRSANSSPCPCASLSDLRRLTRRHDQQAVATTPAAAQPARLPAMVTDQSVRARRCPAERRRTTRGARRLP